MKTILLGLVLGTTLLCATPALAQETGGEGPPTSRPASAAPAPAAPAPAAPAPAPAPTSARPAGEYRFDALRIDGTLHGPEALDLRSSVTRRSGTLTRRSRSFLHRIFETLEEASLHGG